jgi:hypothetical protein
VNNDPPDPESDKTFGTWQIEVRVPEDFRRPFRKLIAAGTDRIWLARMKSFFVLGAKVSVSRSALAAVSFAVFAGVATGVLETSHWNAAI